MKKLTFFLVIGMMFLSAALYAQTTQGSSSAQQARTTSAPAQGATSDQAFGGGGYTGTVLTPIAIADLANATPNQYVIVSGYLVQERVPGTYVLANTAENPTISVVVHLNAYTWANLQIDARTPVLVYGIVSKANLSTEIDADRVEIQK
ncbi:MAG: NirD/YgiW/YdeI family stress tolerance protein [Treponema sp.]|jgi:uncharacterized protein YdeI (BOF family)|nr:NirD/YgiW/YdeI family stress tolerance protein [Treponema sp.]